MRYWVYKDQIEQENILGMENLKCRLLNQGSKEDSDGCIYDWNQYYICCHVVRKAIVCSSSVVHLECVPNLFP